ncbi:MAG: hypothetical protein IJ091_05630 [Oscillospiraceae bacterium]|nr:hypothetical protein [Oscillospiraceae bacterium]
MRKQSKLRVLLRMLDLVRPLAWWMVLAVCLGTLGFLTAQFIPIFGAWGILYGLGVSTPLPLRSLMIGLAVCAVTRAVFRFSEQRTNHYIAFTLLAIVRDRVFKALRKLCPAKLEGRDKGDLISLITSDVELLEVFLRTHHFADLHCSCGGIHHVSFYRLIPLVAGSACAMRLSCDWNRGAPVYFKTKRLTGRRVAGSIRTVGGSYAGEHTRDR